MGDLLNFELVGELAELENIHTRCVFINDDLASDPDDITNRRGIAGIALAVKMAGAASEMGCDLEETARITQKAIDNIRTISVTTSPGYMPQNGKAMCEMEDGVIEYGMGFNGEPGILKEKLGTAQHIVETMMDMLIRDLDYKSGEKNSDSFEWIWLYQSVGDVNHCRRNKSVYSKSWDRGLPHRVEQYLLSSRNGWFSISVMRLDDELVPYYNRRIDTPLYHREEL